MAAMFRTIRRSSPPRRRMPRGASRRLLACLAAAAALVGCRSVDNAQVDLLERELRQQEDYIYELEDYLMEYSEKLRHYRMASQHAAGSTASPTAAGRKKPAVLEPELVEDPPRRGGVGNRSLRTPPVPPARSLDEPALPSTPPETPPADASELPAPESAAEPDAQPPASDPAEMEAPDIEIGDPGAALPWRRAEPVAAVETVAPAFTGEGPAAATTGDEAPPFIPDPVNYQFDEESAPPQDVAETPPVEEQALAESDALIAEAGAPPELVAEPVLGAAQGDAPDRLLAERLQVRRALVQTDADDPTRPAALLAVVEAVNAYGEPVEATGAVSIMVMAPSDAGPPRRVERWDFTAEETHAAWQSSRLGEGLHLQLPLEGAELPPGPLELWARLVADDGGKLLAQLPFETVQLASLDEALAAPAEPSDPGVTLAEASRGDEGDAQPAENPTSQAAQPRWRPAARTAAAEPEGAETDGWRTANRAGERTARAGSAPPLR